MISAVPTFGRDHGIVRYYAAELRRVLRTPAQIATLGLASAMHAAGHALVALVAGSMAVAMARMWGMRDPRSTGLGEVGGGGAPGRSLGEQALVLAAVALGVLAVKAVAGVYATYVQGRVAGEVGSRLRLELLDALLSHHRLRRPGHHDQGEAPGLADRMATSTPAGGASALTDRVHEVEVGLEHGVLGGLRAVAQLVPLAIVLAVLSPRMAAVAFVVLGVFGALLGRSRRGTQLATSTEAREREQLLEAADEAVRHADLWVSYGAEAKARARVSQLGAALALGSARLRARAAALSGANEVLGAAALLLAIAASRAGWLGALADGPTLLAFTVAFFLAYRPLRELADARLALARADGAYRELRAVIGPSLPARADESLTAGTKDPPWTSGTLELRDLRLTRGACQPLSLRVEPGSVVAIAGPTGIGKTTLLRTLLGLEASAGGDVLYDGELLGEAPAGPTTRPFAWVPQDAPLLADTLAENLAMGARGIDPHLALDPLGAAHLAGSLDDARLGAGGRAVSGGERQWIALARAIATRQPVLLLDEPTSGLDALAQGRVLDAISHLKGKRTVLMVTHRPEPLEVADVVVRL
jgi:ABC-type multidrug transport system fused ATPase/permease subunit